MTVFPPEENQNLNPQSPESDAAENQVGQLPDSPEPNAADQNADSSTQPEPQDAPQQQADASQSDGEQQKPDDAPQQPYGYQQQGQPYFDVPYAPAMSMPKQMLKKAIRSDVGKVIGLVLIFELITQVGASFFVSFYTIFSQITGYALSQPVEDFVFSYLPVIVCETAALILGLLWFKTDVHQLFRKPTIAQGEGKKVPLYIGMTLGAIQIGSLIFMLYYFLFQNLFHVEITVPGMTMSTENPVINVLSFLYVVVAGPLLEEIFFRGILMQKIRKYGDMPAIFLTAILFALFHMNFVQLPGPLLFGIAIGMVFSKTNSIWLCWLIHAVNNLFAVIYDYLPEQAADVYDSVLTIVLIAVGVLCFLLLLKDIIKMFRERQGNCTVLSGPAKFGVMLNNVWFYLFFALWLILSLLVQVMG